MAGGRKLLGIARSILVAYMITGMMIFVIAWIAYKCDLSDGAIGLCVIAIYVISNVAGGFCTGRAVEKNRLVYGLLTGLLYVAVLFLVSVLITGGIHNIEVRGISAMLLCIGGAAVGSILS